jgi:uncharacterized protein (DUF1800 family)
MTEAIIAINRFGLGGRVGEKPPENPKRWLLDQLDSFDPSPAPISQRPSSKEALASHLAYREKQRERRRMRQSTEPSETGAEIDTARANPAMDAMNDERREIRQGIRQGYFDDVTARGLVAIESNTPFMERLTHFWSNHFAVSVRKNQVRALAGPYEFEAIRPHIMGSFNGLLKASVLHPAMLIYLDQARSIGPNSILGERARTRRNRDLGLNENLAREILELHTLGVRSGYTQEDVTEFARAMTGWTLSGDNRARRATVLPNGTAYAERLHEPGKRTVMGKSYADTGGQQTLKILDDLAANPATAKHIATKLARHFAADDPPPAMVARLEQAFLTSNGDLPTVYRVLIASPEAWTAEPRKFRQPWEWTIASLRATDPDTLGRRGFFGLLNELGQMPWGPTSPAGYDDTMASWAGPDALIRRVEAAERIASRHRAEDVPALARDLFGNALNETTATWLRRAESSTQALALLLTSPEMMRR